MHAEDTKDQIINFGEGCADIHPTSWVLCQQCKVWLQHEAGNQQNEWEINVSILERHKQNKTTCCKWNTACTKFVASKSTTWQEQVWCQTKLNINDHGVIVLMKQTNTKQIAPPWLTNLPQEHEPASWWSNWNDKSADRQQPEKSTTKTSWQLLPTAEANQKRY